jgi:hypothetical protein
MNGQLEGLAGAIVGLVGAGIGGFYLGRRFRLAQSRRLFWVWSILSLAIGMLVIFVGEMIQIAFLAGAGVGLITGGLNGLRWGMGRLSDAPRPSPARPAEADPPHETRQPERSEDHRPHPAT